jgi:surface polysaccharide O-acyltransferase-like enzyme
MRRYHSLDKLKVLCSFLIICIHAPFPGGFGDYFTTLTRIAVPIFFMISGFFWNPMNGKKQVLKLLKLLVIANAIYFAFDLAKAIDSGIDVYIQAIFTVRNFLKFVLLNQSPFAPHLWYLGAIIYALVAFQIMEKMGLKRFLLYFIPILLLGDLILGKYSLLLLHREFPYVIVRNWLFVGIPYFGIGYVIRENREWIERKLNKLIVAGGVVAFSITSLLERYLLVAANLNTKRDHYISTTFLAIAVFLLFLYFVDNQESILAKIGREDSTWIYILHYLFISALGFAVRRVGMVDVYNIVRPVIVFVLTTALVDLMYRVKASRM